MKVSVIVPTYNAENYLPSLLENLKQQSILFELIIIDSSSTDNTVNIAKKYTKNIITISKLEFDHGGTRTKAAKTATGDIIIYLTQDALPQNEKTLETIVNAFTTPNIAAIYGRQIPYPETSLFGKHLRYFNYGKYSYTRCLHDKKIYGIKTAFLSDSFAAYKKDALEKIGWFKNDLIVGEDSCAGAKLLLENYTLAYCAEANVYHSHSYSPLGDFKRYFDIGVFHQREHWILDEFGKAKGEGKKYVFSEFNYLIRKKAYLSLPEFLLRNLLKYLGYSCGYNYTIFPQKLVPYLSMHNPWWEKERS